MRHFTVAAALLASAALIVAPACAQPIQFAAPDAINNTPVSAANPLPVTGTFSASFSGFTPTAGATAALPVTTTSADVALPAGASVIVTNTGSADAAFRIQVGAGTAVTTDFALKAGAAIGMAPGTATHISAITVSGSTSLNIQGGTGGATGYGGGSSGGGGGAATIADGADTTQGAKADSAATTDTGTFTHISLFKRLLQGITTLNGAVATATNQTSANTKLDTLHTDLATLNTTAGGAIPAGSALIGKVGIDQTTPGTTNGVQDAATSATGSAVPSKAGYAGANSGGNLVGIIQADTSAKVSISTNTITQVVALSSGKKIYVTNFGLHSAGATTTKWVYGTGSNCGTGTTDVTDLYDLTASDGMVLGSGLGPVLVVPASQALCISNSASVHVGGSVAYTQF